MACFLAAFFAAANSAFVGGFSAGAGDAAASAATGVGVSAGLTSGFAAAFRGALRVFSAGAGAADFAAFGALLGAAFFGAAFFAAGFLAGVFFAAAFLAAFLGAAFLGAAFLRAAFFGAAFLGVAFLRATFFGAAFFVVLALPLAVAFLAVFFADLEGAALRDRDDARLLLEAFFTVRFPADVPPVRLARPVVPLRADFRAVVFEDRLEADLAVFRVVFFVDFAAVFFALPRAVLREPPFAALPEEAFRAAVAGRATTTRRPASEAPSSGTAVGRTCDIDPPGGVVAAMFTSEPRAAAGCGAGQAA